MYFYLSERQEATARSSQNSGIAGIITADPFMADSDAIGVGHETAALFRTPFVPQLSGYSADQAGQALGHLPGKPASPVAEGLGLLRTSVATDRAAVVAKLTGDLVLTCPIASFRLYNAA